MNYIRLAMEALPGHWYKGSTTDRNGNYCGIGMVERMCLTNESPVGWHDQGELMDTAAKEMFPDRIDGDWMRAFAIFNDHPDTTFEDVMSVMEKAAIRWDEVNG